MAEEITRLVTIDVGKSTATLKELKTAIEKNAVALAQLEEGTEEYDKAAETLAEQQEVLNKSMKLAKSANTAAEGSYNALTKQMAKLKREWKAIGGVNDEDKKKREALAAEINAINNQLKVLDGTTGNYQRNVGNYANSIVSAFTDINNASGGAIKGIGGMSNALTAMSATPVIAILGALVAVIQKVISNLNTSEESVKAVTAAFAPFRVIGDVVTNTMQALGKALGKVGEWLQKVLKHLNLWTESMQAHAEVQKMENELLEAQRRILVENAKIEQEIADLRYKAKQADVYSEKQRLVFLDQAMAKQKQILENDLYVAQQQLEIARKKATFTNNSTADMQELAELEANVINLQTKAIDTMRTYETERQTLLKKIGKTAEEVQTEVQMVAGEMQSLAVSSIKSTESLVKNVLETPAVIAQKAWELVLDEEHKQQEAEFYADRIQNIKSFESAVSSSLKSVSTAWQSNVQAQLSAGKISQQAAESQFKVIKALNASSVMIDSMAAAWAAYKSATKATGIWGQAVAWAQFASIIAKGTADMMAIKNTTLGSSAVVSTNGSASSVSAVVSSPIWTPTIDTTRTLTSASTEEQLNQMAAPQRVYVVASDIEAVGARVAVQASESTF